MRERTRSPIHDAKGKKMMREANNTRQKWQKIKVLRSLVDRGVDCVFLVTQADGNTGIQNGYTVIQY